MKIILTHIEGSQSGSISEYEGPLVRVGRDPGDCDLVFDSVKEPGVSRLHAEISFLEGHFYLEDLNSRNGTFLDSTPVKGKVEIANGSLIRFGAEGPVVRFEFEKEVPQTQPLPTLGPQAKALSTTGERPPLVCKYCGAKFVVSARFCRRCGKPVESFESVVVEKEPEPTPPAAVKGKAASGVAKREQSLPVQKCYSCGEELPGDPRFCPSCGAVTDPDSARLHSDDLRDIFPPPAATAYVALGKMTPPSPPPPKQERTQKPKRNLKSLSGAKQSKAGRNQDSPTPTPQKLSDPETQGESVSQARSKFDIPHIQRPGPLIPPARKESQVRQQREQKVSLPLSEIVEQERSIEPSKPSSSGSPSPANTLMISAQALAKKGHIVQAIEECERAIRLDSQFPEIYNLLGQLFLQQGESAKAITAFERALKLRPTMAEAYSNLGQAYLRAGRFEDAAVTAREAIKIDHVFPEAYNTIGQALMEIGDYDRAFEAFSRALKVRPNYPESYLGIATVQFRCGHAEEAINSCQLALKARSNFPQAYCLMGQAYRARGQFEEAGQAFKEAIRLKHDYAIAYNYLALNYRSRGISERANEACSRAIDIDPKLPEAHNTMGLLYCDKNQYSEGLIEYQKAIDLRPRYAEAHNNIGLCYFKTGELERAIEFFEKAIELEPQFVLARFNLALCFFKKRDKYGVKKQYEVLREIDEARAAKLYQKIKTLI
jgi:tetratricopeptide (TPR) repeat protein